MLTSEAAPTLHRSRGCDPRAQLKQLLQPVQRQFQLLQRIKLTMPVPGVQLQLSDYYLQLPQSAQAQAPTNQGDHSPAA